MADRPMRGAVPRLVGLSSVQQASGPASARSGSLTERSSRTPRQGSSVFRLARLLSLLCSVIGVYPFRVEHP